MTEEERKELETLEGPLRTLTQKPLIEMSNQELETFVTSIRDCSTQFQTMIAEARVKDKEKPDANKDLFE